MVSRLGLCLDFYSTGFLTRRREEANKFLGTARSLARLLYKNGKILRGRKCRETADVPMSELLTDVDSVLQCVMLSKRQSAEW